MILSFIGNMDEIELHSFVLHILLILFYILDAFFNFYNNNRALDVCVGVYKPIKQKLFNNLQDHLSSLAHLVELLPMSMVDVLKIGISMNWFSNIFLCDLLLQ